jgi:hypothetical protein
MKNFTTYTGFFMFFFHQKVAEILAHRQHWPTRQTIFFAWLFWAAGCQIDFRQEGYLNL